MRILIAHNRYQFAGGEDAVVRDEVELLRRLGHSVELLEQDNEAIHGIRGKMIASISAFYSPRSRDRMKHVVRHFQPQLVHVHNWFPMLSPSVMMEADAAGTPTVQTLHNFRMLCANALLHRDGVVCTDCVGKTFAVDGMLHGCYRGSHAGSAIVTAAYAFHRMAHTWDGVDLFIAASGFQRDLLVRGGLPARKVVVKPNFVASDGLDADTNREDMALYVGRLSPEKGIATLLKAWDTGKIGLRLKIIGEGPMTDQVRCSAARNTAIQYAGPQPPQVVYREMSKAKFLVFPSECFETFGRTMIEAFCRSTPVLAADLGGAPELVEEGVTGYRFPPGDAVALAAGALRFPSGGDYERMGANCRNLFESQFTAEVNGRLLMQIYDQAAEVRKNRPKTH